VMCNVSFQKMKMGCLCDFIWWVCVFVVVVDCCCCCCFGIVRARVSMENSHESFLVCLFLFFVCG
jgi:hypothetical protein